MADLFQDADPDRVEYLLERVGIDRDYYPAVVPEPTEAELEESRKTLRRLTGTLPADPVS